MNQINKLREKLSAVNLTSTRRLDFSDMSEILKVLHELKLSANNSDGISGVSEDKVVAAIKSFAARQSIKSMLEARLLSYGCTHKLNTGYILIEDEVGFNLLISYLEKNKSSVRQFRKCYRGLLHGYFTYNIQSAKAKKSGVNSWNKLKRYLSENVKNIQTSGFVPDWVPAIINNANLFGNDPCAKYGLKALNGDRSDFDTLKIKLEISSDSWLFEQFINAQIDAGIRLSDDKFKMVISPLLDILSENVVLQDSGLAKIINRYFSNDKLGTNIQLKDYVISLWKNPWLNTHSSKWALISPKAKQKIEEWLKLELITQFFSLLAEDGANDLRRVNFWKKHHKKITDMYFVLATNVSFRYTPEFKKIRVSMEGRMLDMTGSDVSAFIMRIGDYYFIEFGQTNNATYIFKADKFPINLSKVKTANVYTLKDRNTADSILTHHEIWGGFTKWEDRFDEEIKKRLVGSVGNISSSVHNDNARYSRLLRDNRFTVEDFRNKGGRLWLTPKVALSFDDVRELESNGFVYASSRKSYYRSD